MAEQFVGKASEIKDGDRRIVFVGEHEIGVFKEKGEYFAYSNFCLHQGGPACEGLTIAKVEERIMPDKTSRGLYFSETEMHFVCPWHGYEYDMKTGVCGADRGRQSDCRAGAANHRHPDGSHGHGERPVARRQSGRVRARHVAELDRPLNAGLTRTMS